MYILFRKKHENGVRHLRGPCLILTKSTLEKEKVYLGFCKYFYSVNNAQICLMMFTYLSTNHEKVAPCKAPDHILSFYL